MEKRNNTIMSSYSKTLARSVANRAIERQNYGEMKIKETKIEMTAIITENSASTENETTV